VRLLNANTIKAPEAEAKEVAELAELAERKQKCYEYKKI
jgi:hypothetical protein